MHTNASKNITSLGEVLDQSITLNQSFCVLFYTRLKVRSVYCSLNVNNIRLISLEN